MNYSNLNNYIEYTSLVLALSSICILIFVTIYSYFKYLHQRVYIAKYNYLEKVIITYLKYPYLSYRIPSILTKKSNLTIVENISLEILKNFKGIETEKLKNFLKLVKIDRLIYKEIFYKNQERHITSIQLLGYLFKDKKSKDILLQVLDNNDTIIIIQATILSLSKLKNPELFFKKIIDKISTCDPVYFNASMTYFLFSRFGNKIEDQLIDLIKDPNTRHNLKTAAIKSVGSINSKKSLKTILSIYNDPREDIRIAVFQSLAYLGYKIPIRVIRFGLQDSNKKIVIECMKCVKYSSQFPKQDLINLLTSENWFISLNAALTIADYGPQGIKIIEEYASQKSLLGNRINSFLNEVKETNAL